MKKYKKIYIEITNTCNLSCSFCPKTARKARQMSVNEFKTIVEKTKNHGEDFYLHVVGEPLSHKYFSEILEVCKLNNLKVNITTNGTLLPLCTDAILQNNIKSVSVSLHSFEANAMSTLIEDYLTGIAEFYKRSRETSTRLELRLWNLDKENLYDKNKLNTGIISFLEKSLCLDYNLADAITEKFHAHENRNSRKYNILLNPNLVLGTAEYFEWPDLNKSTGAPCKGFCYGLRNQLAILSDGTVVPCCLDSDGNIPLGNILTDSLEDIVSSERALNLYNNFSNRLAVEQLCQGCGYMKSHS